MLFEVIEVSWPPKCTIECLCVVTSLTPETDSVSIAASLSITYLRELRVRLLISMRCVILIIRSVFSRVSTRRIARLHFRSTKEYRRTMVSCNSSSSYKMFWTQHCWYRWKCNVRERSEILHRGHKIMITEIAGLILVGESGYSEYYEQSASPSNVVTDHSPLLVRAQ